MKLRPMFWAAAACTLLSINSTLPALAASCAMSTCRYGGNVPACWNAMLREATAKRRVCKTLQITSGMSSYAMATSLPGICIQPSAVIHMHRPYRSQMRTIRVGTRWHSFYFDRISSPAVRYFTARGGMKQTGYANATNLIGVPAGKTGLPICN